MRGPAKYLKQGAAFLAALIALCLLAGGCSASAAAPSAGFAGFSIEQVYVNVPELDVFVTAQDENGRPLDPAMVQAAGVELYLGEEKIPTGNIALASEPICYILVLDNSTAVQPEDFRVFRAALRNLVKSKGERDQIMLYTTAGGPARLLAATDDASAALRALEEVEQTPGTVDVAALVETVYTDVHNDYQSLAPRKCLYICTDAVQMMANPALLAGLSGNAVDRLNMAVTAFAITQEDGALSALAGLTGGRVVTADRRDMPAEMRSHWQALGQVLECKTEVDLDAYGERLDTLTVAVPGLGSAVQDETSVYMGHRLTRPAVEKAVLTGRDTLTLTFNQAVSNADSARRFVLSSDDVWGWRPAIRSVALSGDGMTATLTLQPLYNGRYNLRLREVASRLTPANISDNTAVTTFTVTGSPPDSLFYWQRFRVPVLVLGALLLALAGRSLWQRRRDRAAEQQAEAEHLLDAADETADTLPARWLTLYVRTRRSVAETRWTGRVRGSLIVGTDPAQCDLCIEDHRARPQHCILWVEADRVLVQALEGAIVHVGDQRIGDAHVLQNNDVIKLGRTTMRVVL